MFRQVDKNIKMTIKEMRNLTKHLHEISEIET